MIIALPLVAAFLLGVGFVLQQRAASRAPQADVLKLRLLWDLAHSPQWLAGMASMVCGQIVSAIALGQSSISIVEPLLATNLLIALLLSGALTRSPLRKTDWIGCLVLGSGLATFLAAGAPATGSGWLPGPRSWSAVAGIGAVAGILVLIGRGQPKVEEGTLLAGAAGCLAGLQDGLTRMSVLRLERGFSGAVRAWEPYAVVAVAVVVILLQQSAFKVAPLRDTLPAVTVGEPIAGVVFGIVALGDHVRGAPWAVLLELGGLFAMVGGVYVLATSDLLAEAVGERHTKDSGPPR